MKIFHDYDFFCYVKNDVNFVKMRNDGSTTTFSQKFKKISSQAKRCTQYLIDSKGIFLLPEVVPKLLEQKSHGKKVDRIYEDRWKYDETLLSLIHHISHREILETTTIYRICDQRPHNLKEFEKFKNLSELISKEYNEQHRCRCTSSLLSLSPSLSQSSVKMLSFFYPSAQILLSMMNLEKRA